MIPFQERLMSIQLKIRKEANKWTDGRAKILLEVLGAMRVVKYFSYEIPFLKRRSTLCFLKGDTHVRLQRYTIPESKR